MKTDKLIAFISLILTQVVYADGDHAAPKQTERPPHSAVTAFDPEEGFKLSDAALNTLGVRFAKLGEGRSWTVPLEALVKLKHSNGIYRRTEGTITFVLARSSAKQNGTVTIRSEDLQAGDEVAVAGVPFLRMTEADLNSDTVDSCSH